MGVIRERPTVSGKYTKEDLTRYAEWRKNRALNNITRIIAVQIKKCRTRALKNPGDLCLAH